MDQLESLLEAETHSRVNFIDITAENLVIFTVIDQLQKKFRINLFFMGNEQIVEHVKFKTRKVIAFSKLDRKNENIVSEVLEMEKTFI